MVWLPFDATAAGGLLWNYKILLERLQDQPAVKAAMILTGESYMLSFEHDRSDVYGKGIDLTSRLLAFSLKSCVIVNEEFFDEFKRTASHLEGVYNYRPEGPWTVDAKGFGEVSAFRFRF